VQPGAGRSRPARAAAGEPDIPLPPEPTDDDWPHPASPAAGRAAAARTDAAEHGAGQAGGPPRAAAESSPAPRGGEPTPVVSANPEPAADDGELTTTDVRRMWPELLAVVKRHKRTTEALLKNAQVHQLSNGVLTLATSSPALARRLGDDLNKDVIREALNELLGVRWRVDAVVEGAAAAAGPPVPPEQAREAARAAEAAEARELMAERAADASAGGDREPDPVVDPEQAALSLLRAQLGARPVDG
jgi:DNA polymerase-3 subunit gamma/tau